MLGADGVHVGRISILLEGRSEAGVFLLVSDVVDACWRSCDEEFAVLVEEFVGGVGHLLSCHSFDLVGQLPLHFGR